MPACLLTNAVRPPQLVLYVQLLIGKDSQARHTDARTRSSRSDWILQFSDQRHVLQFHSRGEGVQTIASGSVELPAGRPTCTGGVRCQGAIFSRFGDENFGQWIAGYPLFDIVEAF